MFKFIKKNILVRKQRLIKSRYPGVNIILHPDMPLSSMNTITQLAGKVSEVNRFEPAVSVLSDQELRAKTEEFKARIAKRAQQVESDIQGLESAYAGAAIQEEKERISYKIKVSRNSVFDEVLAESFAVVREASKRSIGLRHFDVQIAGGLVLHEGQIAEMATGEGKTLVATLPAYLNALLGKGVHIITVNDYLARRDREWMGPVFEFLGLSVGVIQHDMSDLDRQKNYACDITYGTNNEFGFDYLRDNMKYSLDELVQRPFYYAIIDEVDSILIDEARTPLIISGPAEESTEKYSIVDRIVPRLKGRMILEKDEIEAKYAGKDISAGFDYIVNEKAHTVYLTEAGEVKVCSALGVDNLHEIETMEWRHHVIQALRAHNLFKKDVDYVVKDAQVVIVDEFTGRMMPGRRWSDGLHQAVETKEKLKIERENQTLATVTFQNYFRMYEKLSGMTGTATTEAQEFKSIYRLDVVSVPTNRQLVRDNYPDSVYKSEKEKFTAAVEKIAELHACGRPVLVGTISIEKSELLSHMLKIRGIHHQVLNAKYHEMEAQIVAQAGRFKAVTIATNMAGRGTDILLGGNPEYIARSIARQKPSSSQDPGKEPDYQVYLEKYKQQCQTEHNQVVAAGGLYILGTERHESRRIDNQLRGRCGRQGDPGASKFFISLEDDLMRLFGSGKLIGIMDKLGIEEGQVIEHPWINRSIEIAQKRVEAHNFEIRKQLLEYDNVMNKQREVIYSQRRQILEGTLLKDNICGNIKSGIDGILSHAAGVREFDENDISGFTEDVRLKFGIKLDMSRLDAGRQKAAGAAIESEAFKQFIYDSALAAYEEKEMSIGPETMRQMERMVYLQIIDSKWKDHLYAMDTLREGIGLRAYGQRDPLLEYKREAFEMFSGLIDGIEDEAMEILFKLQPVKPTEYKGVFSATTQQLTHPQATGWKDDNRGGPAAVEADFGTGEALGDAASAASPGAKKVGRNDPCPCGSGKKYKKCCGR